MSDAVDAAHAVVMAIAARNAERLDANLSALQRELRESTAQIIAALGGKP